MREELKEYLMQNKVAIDENENFEMFIIIAAADNEHVPGSIFHGTEAKCYSETDVYDVLKKNVIMESSSFLMMHHMFDFNPLGRRGRNILPKIEKKLTIKERLLTADYKIFKVLVNESNITGIGAAKMLMMHINKYKVLEEVQLQPVLKFKIESFDEETIRVILYNNITGKFENIRLHGGPINDMADIKSLIDTYLANDEKQIALINSINEDGAEL